MKPLLSKLVVSVFVLQLLTACGGGGSGSGGFTGVGGGSSSSSSSGSGSSGSSSDSSGSSGSGSSGTTTPVNQASLALKLTDSSSNVITAINESTPATVSATFLDASSNPVKGEIVEFSVTDSTIATLDPISGTALTDSNGVASITLKAGTAEGATTVKATSTSDSITVNAEANFETSLANLALGSGSGGSFNNGALTPSVVSPNQLSAGGTMTVTANVVDLESSSALYANPVEVTFTSACTSATPPTASIDTAITTTNGTAVATYRANGCEGTDTITASIPGGHIASTTIQVASAAAGSVAFESISKSILSTKGNGTTERPEFAVVIFKVFDISGNPVAGQDVNFELVTTDGSVELQNIIATSDSNGLVQTVVNSGNTPTSVSVKASFNSGTSVLSTVSNKLSIATGLPAQNRLAINPETLNSESWNITGVEVPITIRAGDDNSNFAPKGTSFTLSTEAGDIESPCVIDNDEGSCTVKWISKTPRPASGRATIYAYTVGMESFDDSNNNGLYDLGETIITNLPEPFRDDNESGLRDVDELGFSEPAADFNGNAQYDDADAFYNGPNCSDSAKAAGHCANLTFIFKGTVIVLSTSAATITIEDGGSVTTGFTMESEQSRSLTITYSDTNGNALPKGTAVACSFSDGSFVGTSSFTVGNTLLPSQQTINIRAADVDKVTSAIFSVEVTSPNGTITSKSVSVTINP